jgi:hypothetical protein
VYERSVPGADHVSLLEDIIVLVPLGAYERVGVLAKGAKT